MGMLIQDDHHVGTLLDALNVRFAPDAPDAPGPDGIAEMADIQQKFKVFAPGRSLKDSFSIMNLGASSNTKLKHNWYKYLESLAKLTSDKEGQNADQRAVSAIIENFDSGKPLPVYFTVHDFDKEKRLTVTKRKPLVYMNSDYLVISLPMRAQQRKSTGE